MIGEMVCVKGQHLEKGEVSQWWTVGAKKVQKKTRRTGQCKVLHDLAIEMNSWLMRDRRWTV